MQYLDLPLPYRDQMNYMNNFYGIGTYAAETLEGGVPWEQLLTERILQPLGMDDTTFIHLAEDRWDEFAKGHGTDDGELREISLEIAKWVVFCASSFK